MYNVYLNNVKHGETNEKRYLVPNLETGKEHEFRVHDGVNEDTVKLFVPMPGQDLVFEVVYEKDGTGNVIMHTQHTVEQHLHMIMLDGEVVRTTDLDIVPIPFHIPLSKHVLEIGCVRNVNEGGYLRPPVRGEFTTPAFDKTIVPQIIATEIITDTQYKLTWEPCPYDKGYYEGVELEITVNNNVVARVPFDSSAPLEYLINANSQASTTYVRLRYYCPRINEYSNYVNRNLETMTPQIVSNFKATDLYFDGFKLTWNALNGNAVSKTVSGYTIHIGVQPNVRTVTTPGTSYEVRGLPLDVSDYYVQIYANYTDKAKSRPANITVRKRTQAELELDVKKVEYRSLELGVNLAAPFKDDIARITIGAVTKEITDPNSTVTFTGLRSDINHTVKVEYQCDYANGGEIIRLEQVVRTLQFPAIPLKLEYPTFSGAVVSWETPPYADQVSRYFIISNGDYMGSSTSNTFEITGEPENKLLALSMFYETIDGQVSPHSDLLVTRTLPITDMKLTVDPADITTTSVLIGSTILPFAHDNLSVNILGTSDNLMKDIPKVKFINLTSGQTYEATGIYTTDFGTPKAKTYPVEGVTFTLN